MSTFDELKQAAQSEKTAIQTVVKTNRGWLIAAFVIGLLLGAVIGYLL